MLIKMADNRHNQAENQKIHLSPKYKPAMSVLILLIAFSILIAGGFLIAFIWSVKKGQYDDDYTPSVRMLFDDNPAVEKNPSSISKQK
jgi:cbb3-type cytochrome oxidase maturation protein